MEYSAKTRLPLNSNGIIYPLSLLHKLSIGIIFHSYFFYQWGESIQGLSSFLFWRLTPKGEKIFSPKQKDRTFISKKIEIKF
jgi:hypothetical protein